MKLLCILLFFTSLLSSNEKIILQLDWKHQFEFAGFYAAKSQGYYDDIGLDVEFKELGQNISITNEVLEGRADFGVSSSSLLLDKLANKNVVLISSYFKQNALALVTRENIKSLKDLKNKKIMATINELQRTSLSVMLHENGINKDDYEFVEHEFKIDKFASGEVDAMSVFITNQLYDLNKQGIKYNLFIPSDFGIYSYDLELFSSQKFINENRVLVENFREASRKGWEYAFRHKEEIVELIYTKYLQEKSREALLYEAERIEELFKVDTFTIGSVVSELVILNAVIYEKLGLVDKNISINSIVKNYIFEQENKSVDRDTEMGFTYEEQLFIAEQKVIKIANEMSWAPFNYNEFGKAKGLSIEYIKLLFKKVGLQYEFVNGYTWTELLSLFKQQKIDLMPDFYKSVERDKYTLFSMPYYQGELSLFVLENMIDNSDDFLVGKKIGIEKSDASIPLVQKHFSSSQVIEYLTPNELFEALESKEIDAFVCNPLLIKHYNKETKSTKFKELKSINLSDKEKKLISLHIGVSRKMPILHSILQKAINSLSEEELHNLKMQWVVQEKEQKIFLTKEEKEYLNFHPIKVCIDPDWMPFEKLENGIHIGMSADYFKIIQKNLGVSMQIVETSSWSQSIQKAKNRECDILSLAMSTPKRQEYMNFTSPYIKMPLVLATKMDVPFISDFDSLENKSVAIPKGYAYFEILKLQYPNLNLVEVEDIRDGLEKVKEGSVFGYVGSSASIGYMFQTEYTGELKIAGKFENNWDLGIAVRNDDKILLNILQKAVLSIDKTQDREILNKWVAIKYEKGVDYLIAWRILGISTFILILFLYWTRKLSLLNTQLKIAKLKAEEATQEKANFLANMSHEIRTPMNSIAGISYLIKETNLNKIQYDYVQKIETASKNLLTLLNDILDFSKMEAKKLEIQKEDFNLLEVLNNVENILKLKTYEKGLAFSIEYDKNSSMHLNGDSMRISQILTNLVSNAIKFTAKGKVEVLVEKVNTKLYRFSVIDTGIGISKKDIENIFSSFVQADGSVTRKYGGTGLGLAIAKELVTLMNGRLWVESILDEGSEFIFEIPLELSSIQTKEFTLDSTNIETKEIKPNIAESKRQRLFSELKSATIKRRPQLCEPLIEELNEYSLGDGWDKKFESVKSLIKSYKFEEAKRILDED